MAKDATTPEPSTEVEPWSAGEVPQMIEATPELANAAYAAIFDGQLPPEVGDPAVTARAIADRIRYGETFDDVFGPAGLKSWQDYEDVPVIVHAFHLNPSTFKDGQAVYAAVELGIPETGDLVTVSCGGLNVLTQLVKAWEQNWFPFRAVLRARETSTPGQKALRLEKA